MPIYKIDLPPIMGKGGKLFFEEIELPEAQASMLIAQKVLSPKREGASAVIVSPLLTESLNPAPDIPQEVEEPLPSSDKDSELLEFFNNASVEDLGSLRNIGKTRAEKIKQNAPYTALQDVQTQSGLSNQGWQDAIADLLP